MLVGAAGLGGAAVLVLCGSVDWSAALPLALGLLADSRVGPLAARHLPADLPRRLIAVLGLLLALDPGAQQAASPLGCARRRRERTGRS